MPNHLFDALFDTSLAREQEFLVAAEGAKSLTHGAFEDLACRYAAIFTKAGVAKGDRVAVQVNKSAEALAVYAACTRCGAVLLPLNTAYTPDEVAYFLTDASPSLVVCDPARQNLIQPLSDAAGATLLTLSDNETGSLIDAGADVSPLTEVVDCGPDDLAAILYTSGTTGRPKGAMLSHDNLLSNSKALATLWRFTSDDVLIHALPIFHTHGLFVAVNVSLLAGARMIFFPKFDPDMILDAIPRATSMMGVPTFYTRLLSDDRLTRDLVANMRLFVSGSAPLLAETHRDFEARTGHRILERYGMTETNMNTSNPYDGDRVAGTVGFPLPGVEVRVGDPETGAAIPRGETGMVEVRGPNVFQGYWQMPEKTREEFRDDGFFITGDLGKIDERGYLHIVGRRKDLIISGGYNIYPKEIEQLLDDQPGVLESAVVGVPHKDLGEGVVAIVVGEKDAVVRGDDLLAGISGSLARFKQPRKVFIVETLPRNTMGKVQKNILRETYKDALR